MDFVGITFDGKMKDYVTVKAIKISKWIDPNNFSLDTIFRLTVEHKYGKDGFKEIKELYVYFKKEDFVNVTIDRDAMKKERKRLEKSQKLEKSKEHKLEERISPLEGYVHPILTKKAIIERKKEKKRIRIVLDDYTITEETRKRNIFFSLRFKKSIVSFNNKTIIEKTPWSYDCLIEPYLVQTLKWNKEEFIPPIESLEVWLQIPKETYGSISAVSVQPVGHFEQMFLLGKDIAKKFRKVGQPLAQEEILCINWIFSNISISSPPEEIEVTCGLRHLREEDDFIKRFEKTPEDSILILREILYTCKVKTLDLNYIISGISDSNLKRVLEVFNVMVFRRNLRPMERNLDALLPLLQNFRSLPHGEEFFDRYEALNALISCKRSEDFFSKQIFSRFRRIQEFGDTMGSEYLGLMQDLNTLAKLTKRFGLYSMSEDKARYKGEVLSTIDKLHDRWSIRLINPDRQILINILANWKHIIEKEYEEQVPLPEIVATTKTKKVAFSDTVGIVLSISNIGKGEAKDIRVKLLQSGDYDIITWESETKPHLRRTRPFEPELKIKPKNTKKVILSYEICYSDILKREFRFQFEEPIEFIREKIPFRKIENPYIIGDIVRDSRMFYGREEFIRSIIENFRGKFQINPVFLYGQRRTGKTSILVQLKKRLENEFAPVFFTAQEIFGKKPFYQDFMEKIRGELGFMNIKIPDAREDPFDIFKQEFYAEVKQRLKGKKVVIMIDEYQRIDEFISEGRYDDDTIDFLNALVQEGEIKFVFAGSLLPEELENDKWKELMKFFITMKVSFLERDETIKLITEPVKGLMEYDEGGIEKIISLSGCHPYFVQLICHTMVEHHNRDNVVLIGYNNVTTHLSNYFERGHNVFSDIILVQTNRIQRKILFYMYDLVEKKKRISVHKQNIEWNLMNYEESIGKDEIENSLSYLERKEIIRKSTEHPDYYEFMIDLYRHWVKWNISAK